MPKFKKKPVEIEAIKYTGTNAAIVKDWSEGVAFIRDDELLIDTLEGTMICSVGDWIIRGVQGEYYPCKADIFEKTYDKV